MAISSSNTCNFGVNLNITSTNDYVSNYFSGQYLSMVVNSVVNLPDTGIFIYSREPQSPETLEWIADFQAVATPNDLFELSSGIPSDSDTNTTLYRDSSLNAYFRSRTELEAATSLIQQDVGYLIRALSAKCQNLNSPIIQVYNSVDPAVTDDINLGYDTGTLWTNVISGITWNSLQDSSSNAVWVPVNPNYVYNAFDPTVNYGLGVGIKVGYIWINTLTNSQWVCRDATQGSAVWIQIR